MLHRRGRRTANVIRRPKNLILSGREAHLNKFIGFSIMYLVHLNYPTIVLANQETPPCVERKFHVTLSVK